MPILCALAFALAANGDPELDLAAALARRGWVELAEELCDRIEKSPSSGAAARAGVPLVLAEVAIAKACRAADVEVATRELDAAVKRLRRPQRTPTLDERGMIGWLHVQKSRLLSAAAEDDAARRPAAAEAWQGTAAYYKDSLAELRAMPPGPGVDDAVTESSLELPKALAAQARMLPENNPARRKLLDDAIAQFRDFQFGPSQPILLEAILEEGRALADARDYGKAERCFRSLPGTWKNIRGKGPAHEYATSILHQGVYSLVQTLSAWGKAKDAVAVCDEFLKANPAAERSGIGIALLLAKAEALAAAGETAPATAIAEKIARQSPDSAAGIRARALIRIWTGTNATPEQLLLFADGFIDAGNPREAIVELRRCVERCSTEAARAKMEPVAAYKRAECFRSLGQDPEAAAAWQEVFRKHPKHELAPRAAFEAVRALGRISSTTRDRRDEEQMEKLLDEVERLGLQGDSGGYLKFIRAEIVERRRQYKAAADLYGQVGETCDAYNDALVSQGHCLRLDAEPRGDAAQLAGAEAVLLKALARALTPKLQFVAHHEIAQIRLHPRISRPAEALESLSQCAGLLPPASPAMVRLRETEVQAHLASKNPPAAAALLEKMLTAWPDSPSTARSCRLVAASLEAGSPAQAAHYYRAWLDRSGTTPVTGAETQSVADGLYRLARVLNGVDEKVLSVRDLYGKVPPARGAWEDAARAHELLIQRGGLSEADAAVASTRLAWCLGFQAQTAADWGRVRAHTDKVMADHQLLGKDGTINVGVLQAKTWLLGIYLENAHAVLQLGRTGQKFQFTNALRACEQLLRVASPASEPWWLGKYYGLRCLFERGEGDDLKLADAGLSLLERNYPDFDEARYGLKDRFVELRAQVRAARGPQR